MGRSRAEACPPTSERRAGCVSIARILARLRATGTGICYGRAHVSKVEELSWLSGFWCPSGVRRVTRRFSMSSAPWRVSRGPACALLRVFPVPAMMVRANGRVVSYVDQEMDRLNRRRPGPASDRRAPTRRRSRGASRSLRRARGGDRPRGRGVVGRSDRAHERPARPAGEHSCSLSGRAGQPPSHHPHAGAARLGVARQVVIVPFLTM